MKNIITTLIIILFALQINAQEKKLTLKDAIYYNGEILPKRISQLQFRGNTDFLTLVEKNELIEQHQISPEKRKVILSLDDLQEVLVATGFDSIRRFPRIKFVDDNTFRFRVKQSYLTYNLKNKKLVKLNAYNKNGDNIEFCKQTNNIAYTIDNNLFANIQGKEIQITNDESKEILNGHTVHRVEFGIEKGIFWSPEGNKLAFYHKDESMVADYPLVQLTGDTAKIHNIKYPMAGRTSEEVKLGVYDLKSKKTVFLQTGTPKDHYLTAISWDPSEKFIYVGILNRDQNHLKLNKYDANTGVFINTLFEEKDDKWVEPEHPMYFINDNQFVWFSERDNWNHLYLYNSSGKLIKQITKGEWAVTDFLGMDEKEQYAYFMATKESPIESHLYKADVKTGKITKLTSVHGTHRVALNEKKTYFIDTYSSTDMASAYQIVNTKGKVKQVLQEDKDSFEGYTLGEMEMLTLTAKDGSKLYSRLIKPVGFDPNKKYPTIVYVYGGPHAQLVTDSWLGGAGVFLNYLAQEGFVVFTLDNRGSANRGLEFEQKIFRQCGVVEVEDQMTGIEYLKTLPFVDQDRIGVDGWSYGGFMTTRLKLTHPETFKVAVAGGPVIDWKWYEVMYGERYMDTPQSNPEGFETSSLLNKAEQLEGKLLIIHGAQDPTVVCQQSQAFIREAIKAGKQVDYFDYPTHEHNVSGFDRAHLYEKIVLYFKENL